MSKSAHRSIITLFIVVYLAYMYNAGMILLIPLFTKNAFNVSFTEVGLVTSSFGFARLFTDVPGGRISDKYGKSRSMILGIAMFTLASIFTYLAVSPLEVAIARFAQGVGGALFTVAGYSLLSFMAPEEKRGRYLSYYQLMIFMALITGPVLAGWIAETFGIRAPFLVMSLLGLGAVALATLKLREPEPLRRAGTSDGAAYSTVLKRVLTSWQYSLVNLATFGVFVTYGLLTTTFPLYGQRYMGLSYQDIGLIMTVAAIPNLLSVLWSAVALDRFGRRPSLLIGFGIITTSSLGMLFTINDWSVAALYGLYSFGEGVANTAQATLSIDFADPEHRGSYLGVNRMFNDLGGTVGPIVAGILLDLSFPASPFLAIAIVAVVVAVACTSLNPRRARPVRVKLP